MFGFQKICEKMERKKINENKNTIKFHKLFLLTILNKFKIILFIFDFFIRFFIIQSKIIKLFSSSFFSFLTTFQNQSQP